MYAFRKMTFAVLCLVFIAGLSAFNHSYCNSITGNQRNLTGPTPPFDGD